MYNCINIYLKIFLFLTILKIFFTKKYNFCIDCKNYKIYKEQININNISCKNIEFILEENFNDNNIISLISLKYNQICNINDNINNNINTLMNYKKKNLI